MAIVRNVLNLKLVVMMMTVLVVGADVGRLRGRGDEETPGEDAPDIEALRLRLGDALLSPLLVTTLLLMLLLPLLPSAMLLLLLLLLALLPLTLLLLLLLPLLLLLLLLLLLFLAATGVAPTPLCRSDSAVPPGLGGPVIGLVIGHGLTGPKAGPKGFTTRLGVVALFGLMFVLLGVMLALNIANDGRDVLVLEGEARLARCLRAGW
jgi:hypothetical protein